MIYSVNPGPGEERFTGSFRTMDATGRQVVYCTRVNTETGEVSRLDYDPVTGKFGLAADGRVAVVTEMRPAPLTRVPILPGESYLAK